MKVAEPLLFLHYAIPCASVLVSRKKITQDFLDKMTGDVSRGEVHPEYIETFKTALAFCRAIAKKEGKESIDSEVIHTYFLERHNQLLPKIAKPDVPQNLCRIRTGRVLSVGESLKVKTELGEEKVSKLFVPRACAGDFVAIHYGYACEVLSPKKQ